MDEFELIDRFFSRPPRSASVVQGVGDDAALLAPTAGHEIVASVDMLVEGRHFFAGADPEKLGHKTLAVNLSDLAAMGATPRWALLAGALPESDPAWLAAFARGFYAEAEKYGVDLVGGDTTRGPMNLCVTILGEVPAGQALTRAGAAPGDDIYVSGPLGDAALAVAATTGRVVLDVDALAACRVRLDTPVPRIALGLALRGVASAAIDVSDGLTGDLGHILERSAVGAVVDLASIPAFAAGGRDARGAGSRNRTRVPARGRRRLRALLHRAACGRTADQGDGGRRRIAAHADRVDHRGKRSCRPRRARRAAARVAAGVRSFWPRERRMSDG